MPGKAYENAAERGFTLVEVLVTVMVVGVMAAVVLVAVTGLTGKSGTGACLVSMDAAKAATSSYYAANDGTYPQNFTELTSTPAGQPLLASSSGVIVGATTLKGKGGWTLTMQPGATTADQTTFSGC